jgi:D-amino-acid dehydrogenase
MPAYDVAIVGGGAVGVATAHALAASGARVVLLERDRLGRGCSYGNAGLVVPGHSLPLATPRALRQGLRWLLTGSGPFTVNFRADSALWGWLMRYLLACRTTVMRRTILALNSLAAASLERYRALAEQLSLFAFERRGWLYVYTDPASLAAALAEATELRIAESSWEAVDADEARRLCPLLSERIIGGIFYPDEAHLQPYAAVSSLAERSRSLGAELREGAKVQGLRIEADRLTAVQVDGEELAVGWCVLAAGAESPGMLDRLGRATGSTLLRRIGRRLPVQPARGHSLTWERPAGAPDLPLMFGEAHVIATPMGPSLRMTTGLDLVGFRPGLDPDRVAAIRTAAAAYLPDLALPGEPEAWYGFRPLTPDSRPIIGPLRRIPNLILATGHGQLGITLAPITGELVAAMIHGQRPAPEPAQTSPAPGPSRLAPGAEPTTFAAPLDAGPFSPARFGL